MTVSFDCYLTLLRRGSFPKALIFSTFKLIHIYKRENQAQREDCVFNVLVVSAWLNHLPYVEIVAFHFP